MFLRELDAKLNTIQGIGPAALRTLSRLGISDVRTLLCHYPRDWEDRSKTVPLRDWSRDKVCTQAKVLTHEWFGAGRMKTLKVYIEDDTARAALICFNRPFLGKQLPEGLTVSIYGHFYYKYGEIQSNSFEIGDAKDSSFGRILPVYPLTKDLTQAIIRKFTWRALAKYSGDLEDELPEFIILRDRLLSKAEAIKAIHFPSSFAEKDQARKTLIYEELFYLELMTAHRVQKRKKAAHGFKANVGGSALCSLLPAPCSLLTPLQKRLIERLPFSLTAGQLEVIHEINADMDSPYPMARLLQGDVGSGKTLVAFLACLRAIEQSGAERSGGQAVLMAPTELLARQHAENAARLLEPLGLHIAFLTGNLKAAGRSRLLSALESGDIDMVAGTHALFSKDTVYRNLRLVVVDEQHRFGVTQRQAIMEKGDRPNLLMMSATPIPRTLALTVFGDLDVSVIRDMPPGRKPIKTHLAKTSNADKVYDFVRKELAAGRQAYFVYPLIEASNSGSSNQGSGDTSAEWLQDLKDAETMADKLSKKVFPQYPVALIHSRLDEDAKRNIMDNFRKGEIRVLAATSVVEVGVDVPNASCMVVEHAERFGLAALHQLRGRVGRGDAQSYCFLIYSDQDVPPEHAGTAPELLGEEERSREGKRLIVMLENTDGFIIAEKDLIFRGPGQITGIQQSGYLSLGIADPIRDSAELEQARNDAFAVIESDPTLSKAENQNISEVLKRAPPFGDVTL
ncbi:MAG: ATP-dependent DNA helicase RecG [Treponema sp.]|jgi:ATP-dependent DNA helicase RecG|nr:ATP-dependent DNA helicase RecG [Treponema sp.]